MPLVRGKQFELLAVKELAQFLGDTPQVRPVIEPVRERTSALVRCLDELSLFDAEVTIVLNPDVGDFANDGDAPRAILSALEECVYYSHLRLGVSVHARADIAAIRATIADSALAGRPVDLLHREYAGERGLHAICTPETRHILPEKAYARRYDPRLDGSLVKVRDGFPRRKTNLEYVGVPDALFTDDNLYFEEDGYAGFSDYATIGDDFTEGGSSPRAVVIHLTYAAENGAIWIRHFCSDSNEDTADTAGKFGEAVRKVAAFCGEMNLSNPAIHAFQGYASSGSYPGLGTVKKLSIQNHLYLLGAQLSG